VYFLFFNQSEANTATIVDEKYLRAHNIELQHNPCVWNPGDPVLYNLNTKLGINCEADHWFHMSEMFLTKHSTLRSHNRLSNASITIYNYCKALTSVGSSISTIFTTLG
jgi:3-deoxy-D-manno-octulosonic-acid transferase